MKTEEGLDLNTAWFWRLPQPKYSSQFEECNALEVKNNIMILIELWAWISLKVGGLRANFTADFSHVPLSVGLENRDTGIPSVQSCVMETPPSFQPDAGTNHRVPRAAEAGSLQTLSLLLAV